MYLPCPCASDWTQGIQRCTNLFQAFYDIQQNHELDVYCAPLNGQLQVPPVTWYGKLRRTSPIENVVIFLNSCKFYCYGYFHSTYPTTYFRQYLTFDLLEIMWIPFRLVQVQWARRMTNVSTKKEAVACLSVELRSSQLLSCIYQCSRSTLVLRRMISRKHHQTRHEASASHVTVPSILDCRLTNLLSNCSDPKDYVAATILYPGTMISMKFDISISGGKLIHTYLNIPYIQNRIRVSETDYEYWEIDKQLFLFSFC